MFFSCLFLFVLQHLDLEIFSSSLANLATFSMYAVVSQPLNSPEPDYSPPSLLSDVLHSGVMGFRAPQLDLRLCHWLVLLLTHKDNNGRGMTILYQKNMMHCTVFSLWSVSFFCSCIPVLVLLFCFVFFFKSTLSNVPRMHCHFCFPFQNQLQFELMFGGSQEGATCKSAEFSLKLHRSTYNSNLI